MSSNNLADLYSLTVSCRTALSMIHVFGWFGTTAATLWNNLAVDIRKGKTPDAFKKNTNLFILAFSVKQSSKHYVRRYTTFVYYCSLLLSMVFFLSVMTPTFLAEEDGMTKMSPTAMLILGRPGVFGTKKTWYPFCRSLTDIQLHVSSR